MHGLYAGLKTINESNQINVLYDCLPCFYKWALDVRIGSLKMFPILLLLLLLLLLL